VLEWRTNRSRARIKPDETYIANLQKDWGKVLWLMKRNLVLQIQHRWV
jgi:hypothetical protein